MENNNYFFINKSEIFIDKTGLITLIKININDSLKNINFLDLDEQIYSDALIKKQYCEKLILLNNFNNEVKLESGMIVNQNNKENNLYFEYYCPS